MNLFELEIVTPDRKLFAGKVTSVKVPGTNGQFEILYNHAPIISTLGKGDLRIIKEDGSREVMKIQDGLIEVLKNKAIVLVEKLLS